MYWAWIMGIKLSHNCQSGWAMGLEFVLLWLARKYEIAMCFFMEKVALISSVKVS